MRYLICRVNGGIIYRFRYDPRSVDDCLYVLRQIQDVVTANPPPSIVQIWREDDP